MKVLLQYQSKSYYVIGQDVYYSIGRFITLSGTYYIIGVFYYIIGHVLYYRALITLSVGTRPPSDDDDELSSEIFTTKLVIDHRGMCNSEVTIGVDIIFKNNIMPCSMRSLVFTIMIHQVLS